MMDFLDGLEQTVAAAISEDVGTGDITAQLIDPGAMARARVICRQHAVICGRPWVDEVMRQIDPKIVPDWQVSEGATVVPDQCIVTLAGPARSLLTAERSALNFLQTLSGTASRTRHYVNLVADTAVVLLDTRKTVPGLRLAQKYAVKVGGAENHRIGLFDAFLIKENHIQAAGSITAATARAREIGPGKRLEIEVENLSELQEAVAASPDWIMLDNFSLQDLRQAVELCRDTGIKLEASGGIEDEQTLTAIALTGVDFISLGALTKHCEAVDLSMRIE